MPVEHFSTSSNPTPSFNHCIIVLIVVHSSSWTKTSTMDGNLKKNVDKFFSAGLGKVKCNTCRRRRRQLDVTCPNQRWVSFHTWLTRSSFIYFLVHLIVFLFLPLHFLKLMIIFLCCTCPMTQGGRAASWIIAIGIVVRYNGIALAYINPHGRMDQKWNQRPSSIECSFLFL